MTVEEALLFAQFWAERRSDFNYQRGRPRKLKRKRGGQYR